LTIGIPSHTIITTTIPPNLGKNFSETPKNVAITFVQHIIPYSKPSRKPLNYLEYKKVLIWMFMYEYLEPPLKLMVKQ
jgi:hypothetical protein